MIFSEEVKSMENVRRRMIEYDRGDAGTGLPPIKYRSCELDKKFVTYQIK